VKAFTVSVKVGKAIQETDGHWTINFLLNFFRNVCTKWHCAFVFFSADFMHFMIVTDIMILFKNKTETILKWCKSFVGLVIVAVIH